MEIGVIMKATVIVIEVTTVLQRLIPVFMVLEGIIALTILVRIIIVVLGAITLS